MMGWTPRRKGDLYCSSRCGAGCTYAAYQHAKTQAKLLAEKLGPGWKPDVWENLGWHYKAQRGEIAVYYSKHSRTYTAYFNAACQRIGESTSARLAVKRAIDSMSEYVESLQASVQKAQASVQKARET